MQSIPDYPHVHGGTLIVLGSAPCVFDDYHRISPHRPGAMLAGINEGAGVAPVDFIMTMHGEHMERFIGLRAQFPGRFTKHAVMAHKIGMHDFGKYPVDYWWDAHSGASSAGSAVFIANMMGFDEVILCGCPLTGGDGYYCETKGSTTEDPRIGYSSRESGMMRSYRINFAAYAKRPDFQHVYSMSGHTAEVLGLPPDLKECA